MNDNYEKMKQAIVSNVKAIRHLVEIASSLQSSVADIKDEAVKEKISQQVENIFKSIDSLIQEAEELFNAYKDLFD